MRIVAGLSFTFSSACEKSRIQLSVLASLQNQSDSIECRDILISLSDTTSQ